MKVFILVVIMHVNSGSNVTFQEFNTLEQCQYVAELVQKSRPISTEAAFCVQK